MVRTPARTSPLLVLFVCGCATAHKAPWPSAASDQLTGPQSHHAHAHADHPWTDPNATRSQVRELDSQVETIDRRTIELSRGGGMERLAEVGQPLDTEVIDLGARRYDREEELEEEAPAPLPRKPLVLKWPLPATGVNSLFGRRTDPFHERTRFHRGVDLEAEYGAVVQSSAPGFVVYAGWRGGHGRVVILEHAGGYRTAYAHLSQIVVQQGLVVSGGQAIGRVGNSGRSTGPHLHFEVTRYGDYLDPLDLLGNELAVR